MCIGKITQYCLMLFLLSVESVPLQFPEPVIIAGRVFYKDGSPAKDALITVYSSNDFSGIMPETTTDKKGNFVLRIPPIGEGAVSASDPAHGFPNAAIALYGTGHYSSIQRIAPKSGVEKIEVELHFGDPDSIIDWSVRSWPHPLPIPNARYRIEWSDDPRIYISYSMIQ